MPVRAFRSPPSKRRRDGCATHPEIASAHERQSADGRLKIDPSVGYKRRAAITPRPSQQTLGPKGGALRASFRIPPGAPKRVVAAPRAEDWEEIPEPVIGRLVQPEELELRHATVDAAFCRNQGRAAHRERSNVNRMNEGRVVARDPTAVVWVHPKRCRQLTRFIAQPT